MTTASSTAIVQVALTAFVDHATAILTIVVPVIVGVAVLFFGVYKVVGLIRRG